MNFAEKAKEMANETITENGGFAYKSTCQPVLDLFGTVGAARNMAPVDLERILSRSWEADPRLTLRCVFYAGAIRDGIGVGERKTFRFCLRWLGFNHPDVVAANLSNIAYYTRWDNIFSLFGTPCENVVIVYLLLQLNSDLASYKEQKPISLLAKWLPSANTSSSETRERARKLYTAWGMSERQYRKTLSKLRAYLDVVERKMSRNDWENIDYGVVPSYALLRHRAAFVRHDGERFEAFINSDKKVHAATLFPYDLVHEYYSRCYTWEVETDPVIEKQWNALPNYVEGEHNVLVMADVSGSMDGRPMETAVGLATYFAQRNSGSYKNLYMTFSSKPEFVQIEGEGLAAPLNSIDHNNWGMSTNLEGAMNLVLETAVRAHSTEEELPEALVVISDMAIDHYYRPGYDFEFWDTVVAKFHAAGYKKVPKLVLWNVETRKPVFLSKREDVILVSGQSAATFKTVMACVGGMTAYDYMVECLTRKEFDRISLPENLQNV